MKMTKAHINPADYPDRIRGVLENAEVYDSSSSERAQVLYIEPDLFLKTASKGMLFREAENIKWFHSKGLTEELVEYISADRDYLLMRKVKGLDGTHYIDDPDRYVRGFAEKLSFLHSMKYEDYPLGEIDMYEGIRYAGLADGEYELPVVGKLSRKAITGFVSERKSILKTETLIHGDYCMPNVLMDKTGITGFIDFDRSGPGNKHIDIYWALWSLAYNIKHTDCSKLFMDVYGNSSIDIDVLRTVAALEFCEKMMRRGIIL